jgi:rSAM/selenodomain-associated transferase 1
MSRSGNGHVLYVAAKAPRPGLAKTRLSAGLGEVAALRLYRGFIRDLSVNLVSDRYELGWYITPPDAWLELGILVDRRSELPHVLAQPSGSWTDRQRWLFQTMPARGESRTVLIASDSPQITHEVVDEAFIALDHSDVVLGPTFDGGYYLIGMRPPQAERDVLHCVPMSTNTVLREIVTNAADQGVSLALLESTFDVDSEDDLDLLQRAVRGRRDLPWTTAALDAVAGARIVQSAS